MGAIIGADACATTGSPLSFLDIFRPRSRAAQTPQTPPEPRIYSRGEHTLSREQISEHALKVLYRLHNAGYEAFLVGGGVRDILLGLEPKDFDVATNATPEEIRDLFRNSRLIGRRFRLAHVRFGPHIIEVATFRAAHDGNEDGASIAADGRIVRDNVYGAIHDDVWRRDFTVNALYYDISNFSIVDYVGGFEDLKAGKLRLIGDPAVRYREDPVRMLRAVRFAAKLNFTIDDETREAFAAYGDLLDGIAAARLFDEALKLLHTGRGLATFEALREFRLFEHLFPQVERAFTDVTSALPFVRAALENTDLRIAREQSVTPAFICAALLWGPLHMRRGALRAAGASDVEAFRVAADDVIAEQVKRVAFPRRFTTVSREIWSLQPRLERRSPKGAARLLAHPRFRAAYDFLLLRAQSGEIDPELAAWWTEIQNVDGDERDSMLGELRERPAQKRPRKRRRKPRQGAA